MLMKRKMPFIIIGLFIISAAILFYYRSHYTDAAILENATSGKGYSLKASEEAVIIEVFIKPEWIPFDSEKPQKLNIKLWEKNNTSIILTQVWNRGDDIFFSFDTKYNLDYRKGEFLYNGIFYVDGTFTSKNGIYDILVYDSLNNEVEIGQRGSGPNSSFSFGINPDQYDQIRKGFNLKYSGMTLYRYSLNK
jgi:hypothetical protein